MVFPYRETKKSPIVQAFLSRAGYSRNGTEKQRPQTSPCSKALSLCSCVSAAGPVLLSAARIPFSAGSRCSTRNPPVSPQAGRTPPANNCRPARIPSASAAIATRSAYSRSEGFPAKRAENPLIIEWRKCSALCNLFDFQRFVQMLLDVIDGRLKPFCPALHFVCLLPLRSKYNSRKRFLSRHSVLLLLG